jgi:Flp pilus assembly protein TadG
MLKLLLDRYRRKSQKFARSDSGVAIIEFVFIAPIVFLTLGVIIETGLMLFTEITLQDATDVAARTIRTGKAQMTGLTAADLKTAICAEIGKLVSCSKVVVYVNTDTSFAKLLADVPPYINIGPTTGGITVSAPPCYNPGSPSNPAIIVATYDWYFHSYGISFWGNVAGNKARRLTAVTLFQNQPFPGTGPGTC